MRVQKNRLFDLLRFLFLIVSYEYLWLSEKSELICNINWTEFYPVEKLNLKKKSVLKDNYYTDNVLAKNNMFALTRS